MNNSILDAEVSQNENADYSFAKTSGLGIKVVASVPEGVLVPDESGVCILGTVGVADLAVSPGIVHIFYHFLPVIVKKRNGELPANKNLPLRGGKTSRASCTSAFIDYSVLWSVASIPLRLFLSF